MQYGFIFLFSYLTRCLNVFHLFKRLAVRFSVLLS
jgi:hypothetical protein